MVNNDFYPIITCTVRFVLFWLHFESYMISIQGSGRHILRDDAEIILFTDTFGLQINLATSTGTIPLFSYEFQYHLRSYVTLAISFPNCTPYV